MQVSCKVLDGTIESSNPDGYWYRIASPPWSNAYYAAANTFLNGDPPGGPYMNNTDPNVPDCGAQPSPTPVPQAPEGASVYFKPQAGSADSTANANLAFSKWKGSKCTFNASSVTNPFNGRFISSLAAWSDARAAPAFFVADPAKASHVHYILIIDPGRGKDLGNSCAKTANISKLLANWLSLNKANRLVLVAAIATNADKRKGLNTYFMSDIRRRKLERRTTICDNGNQSHGNAFKFYATGKTSFLRTQRTRCPYGVPTVKR